ncbi:MAG: hypothetical protein D6732_02455 [Methanobacteriota archaeon]|nr:MAG: hypothetical protein D6732_02455 [Euryarchaeota archaeon]
MRDEVGRPTMRAADSGYAARESGRELQTRSQVGGGGFAVTAAAANAHVGRVEGLFVRHVDRMKRLRRLGASPAMA